MVFGYPWWLWVAVLAVVAALLWYSGFIGAVTLLAIYRLIANRVT
jgi:hypothetical protein